MERLTIEFDGNYVPVGLCATTPEGEVDDLDGCKDHCEMIGEKCEECAIQKCFDKLGEYEDLEEQGRLLKLPCACGDYAVFSDGSIIPVTYVTFEQEGVTVGCQNGIHISMSL